MDKLKVRKIVISKQLEDSENYEKFIKIINNKKIPVIIVEADNKTICTQKIQIEKDLYFEILWPKESKIITENSLNNNSIVCKLHYRNFSMLFTGDIEELAEKNILEEYKNNKQLLKSTVLKVAHHGSITSSSKEFIEAVQPQISLIGVGNNNKFGHPNSNVINNLQSIRKQDLSYR